MGARIVLNIDDSQDDVVLLHAACQSAKVSFAFQSVDGGEEAILYLQGVQRYEDRRRFPFPDLILLDLKMPGKSGFDVLQWLRAQEHAPFHQLPVVVFTSSMHEEDAARALKLGADVYLVKPSDFDQIRHLVKTIDALLSRTDIDRDELRKLPGSKLARP